MTAKKKSDEIIRKIEQAKLLATLQDNAAWMIIKDKLSLQIANDKAALCTMGLDQTKTEELRYRIRSMEWCLRSTQLDTPEQFARWEQELAFQQKQEKIRDLAGLNSET